MKRVSFVVPTLNRAGYVNRAVRSCLALASRDVDVEVVVVDSSSEDSSWSDLVDEFGDDPRVLLRQNSRTSGPMRSWLEAAADATGDWITFVWSDDYVFPDFAQLLTPHDVHDVAVVFGRGLVRPIDAESLPSPSTSAAFRVPSALAMEGFMASRRSQGDWPVSPACAVFAARVFRRWMASIEDWSRATAAREAVMWQSAIGPDLLLFLVAVSDGECWQTDAPVAQFSSHPGSITISSSTWPLATGYWMARCIAIREGCVEGIDSDLVRREIYATSLAQGLRCLLTIPAAFKGVSRWQIARQLLADWRRVATTGRRDVGAVPLVYAFMRLLLSRLAR